MLELRPFRGLRFDAAKTGTLDGVVTPPYDVISEEERRGLAEKYPYSMVHLILPQDNGGSRYEVAGRRIVQWMEEGILRQDETPSYYLLRQTFTDLHGATQVRRGFFAAVRIPEEGENTILGHERTFDKPAEDRYKLTVATKTNLGPVFGLYGDPKNEMAGFLGQVDCRPPDILAKTFDGVKQEVWKVDAAPAVAAFLRDQTLYIADGHHRFRTACLYRDTKRQEGKVEKDAPSEFVLMGLVAFEDSGLKIYPPHRVTPLPSGFDADRFLESLNTYFELRPVASDLPGNVEQAVGKCVMGLVLADKGSYLLHLREPQREALVGTDRSEAWRDLDVAVLHRGIIEKLLKFPEGTEFSYEKNVEAAIAAARSGDRLAFILRATRPDQIRACAEARDPMPQKSTYFFPKLPSGAVMHRLV